MYLFAKRLKFICVLTIPVLVIIEENLKENKGKIMLTNKELSSFESLNLFLTNKIFMLLFTSSRRCFWIWHLVERFAYVYLWTFDTMTTKLI